MNQTQPRSWHDKIKGKKFFLFVSAISTLCLDLMVAIIWLLGNLPFPTVFPACMLVVCDILLLVAAIFNNFRFAYSRRLPVFQMILTVGIALCVLPVSLSGYFLMIPLALYVFFHACAIASLILNLCSGVSPSKPLRKANGIISIMFALFTVAYSMLIVTYGVLVQNEVEYRPVKYIYRQSQQGYAAVEFMSNGKKTLSIPETVNGIPVTSLDCALFTSKKIDTVFLQCKPDVTFSSVEKLSNLNEDLTVAVKRDYVNNYRHILSQNVTKNKSFLALANRIIPSGLQSDEVYAVFDYNEIAYEKANHELIPVYIGKKGEKIQFDELVKDVSYAKGFDLKNEGYLERNFNENKEVLVPLTANGATVLDEPVTDSLHVSVEFQKVYRISIQADNDARYAFPDSFVSYETTGYRYIPESDPFNLLADAPTRKGFTLSWWKNGLRFHMLSDVLSSSTVEISPVWELSAPVIKSLYSNKSDFVYGDTILLTSLFDLPYENAQTQISWSKTNSIISGANESEYRIDFAELSDSARYTATITVGNDSTTSLTATASKNITVSVNPRPIDLTWTDENYIYNGKSQAPTVSEVSNLADGENESVLALSYSASNIAAGSYSRTASIGNENYTIKNGRTKNYTILQKEISLSWPIETVYTYDGTERKFLVTGASGLVNGETIEDLSISYSGYGKNVSDYQETAELGNPNYKISDGSTFRYTIEKRQIVLSWDPEVSFTYNGIAQKPTVSSASNLAENEILSDLHLSYTGAQKNAGNEYIATAVLSNNNYEISSGETCGFTILPREITPTWSTDSLVYIASPQTPVIRSATNLAGNEKVSDLQLTYSGEQKDVGTGYLVTAVIGNTNYIFDSHNTQYYSITPATISVQWSNTTLTYNNKPLAPAATAKGLGGDGTFTLTVSGEKTDAGTYSASASLANDNYILANTTTFFTINPRRISVNWQTTNFTYDQTPHIPAIASISNLADGHSQDVALLSVTGEQTNAGNYSAQVNTGNSNYTLDKTSVSFTILPKGITLVWSSTTNFIYDGTIPSLSVISAEGLVGSDDLTALGLSSSGISKTAGTRNAKATIDNKNYKIDVGATCSYSVAKRPVDLTWSTEVSFLYDGNSHKPSVTSASNLASGDTLSGLGVSYVGAKTHVGDYTVTAKIGDSNYEISSGATCDFSITPASVTPTWTTSNLVYTAAAQHPEISSVSGLCGSDTLASLQITYTDWENNKNVRDNYTVTAVLGNNDYVFAPSSGTQSYSITPATISAQWSNTTLTYNNKSLAPTATAKGLGSDGTFTLTVSGEKTDVGTYSASASLANDNYILANTTTSFTINPRPISINWQTTNFTYDQTPHIPAIASISNLADGHTQDDAMISVTGEKTNAGSYSAQVSTGNNNYTLNKTSVSFTITQRSVTPTWNASSFVYNGTYQRPSITSVSGLCPSDSLASLNITYSDNGKKNAGSGYNVTAAIGNSNYTFSSGAKQTYSITKKEVTVVWQNTSFVYDGRSHCPTVQAITGVGSDGTITVSVTGAATQIGPHTATATASNNNYNIINKTCNFTITGAD